MPIDNPTHAEPTELMATKLRERSGFKREVGHHDDADLDLEAATFIESQASRIEALEAENARLREALTPSGDTKADYMGEFSFGITLSAGGEEDYRRMVPWTTIKEIMAAILARSALTPERPKK